MKLWLLRPMGVDSPDVQSIDDHNSPWSVGYDMAWGFVIRAKTETEARAFAMEHSGDEKSGRIAAPWLDPEYSTCVELTAKGSAGLIIEDFHAA